MADEVKTMLEHLKLVELWKKFKSERIDLEVLKDITDTELSRLGVTTIGDRKRLKEYVSQHQQHHDDNMIVSSAVTGPAGPSFSNNNNDNNVSNINSTVSPALPSYRRNINNWRRQATERSSLFSYGTRGGNSARRIGRGGTRTNSNRLSRGRSWTINFMCLASRFGSKIPDSLLKLKLQNAGLGSKKVQVFMGDSEESVLEKLIIAYPKLKDCGGIELLVCTANSKDLSVLSCNLSAQSMKDAVGGSQGRLYIRPIQKSLSIDPVNKAQSSKLQEKCLWCGEDFKLSDLRKHVDNCSALELDDEAEVPFDESIFEHSVFPWSLAERDSEPSNVECNTAITDQNTGASNVIIFLKIPTQIMFVFIANRFPISKSCHCFFSKRR